MLPASGAEQGAAQLRSIRSRGVSDAGAEFPLVAIVIVVFNQLALTWECLTSLRNLEYERYDIYVVDNHSSDGSASAIAGEFPDVKLIRSSRNLGFGGGNNLGIEAALQTDADFVWFLNNDIRVHPTALRELIVVAVQDPRAGAVGGIQYSLSEPKRLIGWAGGRVNLRTGRYSDYAPGKPKKALQYICGAHLLMSRDALIATGGFSSKFFMYYEDADLGIRLRQLGYEMRVAEKSVIWHKAGGSSSGHDPWMRYIRGHSFATFMKTHSPFWPLPVAISVFRTLVSDGRRGRWRPMLASLRGLIHGMRGKDFVC